MSGKTTTSLISLVLVTDASLTIAGEWHRILSDCVGSIIQRLISEIHPGSEMRMGFVAYGAAEGPEGPIVDQRFFQDHQSLMRDLHTKHAEMGIGRASGTCEIGLSTLEAYACALEMFDLQRHAADFHPLKMITLNAEKDTQKTYDRHDYIIHIAAAEPDDARRPRHNDSVAYDELNWDTLPSEIKKHNIRLCMNLLKPIKRFNDLFEAVKDGPSSTPWFTTPPKHTLLLYGFPAPRNKAAKRQNEVDRSPAQKRARIKDVPSPSSPAKANSSSSPYMSPAAVKTPKQTPAVPKTPTTAAAVPPAEPKSTPVLNAAQPPTPVQAPAPAPMPVLSPAPPAPAPISPPTVAPAPAPAPAPNMAAQLQRVPSLLAMAGYYTDVKVHPRFEIGLQNPQQRGLVEFLERYDPIYTEQMFKATQRNKLGQPNPPEFVSQMKKLKVMFEIGIRALKSWNNGGPPINFDQIKANAVKATAGIPGSNPGAAAAGTAAQAQAGQDQTLNQNLGPTAQGMLNQMNEVSKSVALRNGIQPPAGAPSNVGAGARPPSQPVLPQQPQQQPPIPPPQSPANPLVAQNQQRWTGGLMIQVPKPGGPQMVRLEVNALHQAMSDPLMSTWPQNIEIKIMLNLAFAPKDLDAWLVGLKNRGRPFSIVRIQAADVPNPMQKEIIRQNLAKVVELLAQRSCLAMASWNIPGKGTVPTAIFTRMPAGAPENHLIAVVFPQAGFDRNDLPPTLVNNAAAGQKQGSPQQPQNQNGPGQMPQQPQPSNIGMGGASGRIPTAQELAAMQTIAREMGISWEMFQRLTDAEKAKVVHVYTNRHSQMRNGMMGGAGAGTGMRPGMTGAGGNNMGSQMQQMQQQQQQRLAHAQMQAALLSRAGVPQMPTTNAFAGLSASTPGFAGMNAGGGAGNNLGGLNPSLNPGINVGALGGMQPQGANSMGGGFPMSQDQINSWMQRSATGR